MRITITLLVALLANGAWAQATVAPLSVAVTTSTGAAAVVVQGGTEPYALTYTDATGAVVGGCGVGAYTVRVTDAAGATASVAFIVAAPETATAHSAQADRAYDRHAGAIADDRPYYRPATTTEAMGLTKVTVGSRPVPSHLLGFER